MQLHDIVYEPEAFFREALPELTAIDVTEVCKRDPELLERFPDKENLILFNKMYPAALLMLRYKGMIKFLHGCDMPCSHLVVTRWIERVRTGKTSVCDVCYRDDINSVFTAMTPTGAPIAPQTCITCGIKLCGTCYDRMGLLSSTEPTCCFCQQRFSESSEIYSDPCKLRQFALSHRALSSVTDKPAGPVIDQLCRDLGIE